MTTNALFHGGVWLLVITGIISIWINNEIPLLLCLGILVLLSIDHHTER